MERRTFFGLITLGLIGAGAMIGQRSGRNLRPHKEEDPDDWDRRVRFICCDDHGTYSPTVYLRVGAGRAAFDTIREAAPFMRPDDPGSAAAGLCGFLFKKLGYDSDTGGTMSLDPPPQPGPDGEIDWKSFGRDGDIFLINVHTRSAKCCYGVLAGQEIRDLALGKAAPRGLQRPRS
jgi:hypothetical protein